MWLSTIAPLVMFVAAQLPPAGPGGAAPQFISEPIATRQTAFTIPFQVDRATQIAEEPIEVQLFVSSDRGGNWRLYSKVDPLQKNFLFRAVTDGEYWFAVRTLDRSGQLRPGLPQAPVLRVLVDTAPPNLVLRAIDAAGPNADEIRDALERIDGFQAVTTGVPRKPYSKDDHECLDQKDVFLGVWKSGKVVKLQ
jgi:hypothetical protein